MKHKGNTGWVSTFALPCVPRVIVYGRPGSRSLAHRILLFKMATIHKLSQLILGKDYVASVLVELEKLRANSIMVGANSIKLGANSK